VSNTFNVYIAYSTRKDSNNSGGELLIYFKDDISVERVTDLENDNDETIWMKV
jgi:hypothetical protein